MNYACLNLYDVKKRFHLFYEKVISGNFDKVVIFGQNEHNYFFFNHDSNLYSLIEYCSNRIPLEIITTISNSFINISAPNVTVTNWEYADLQAGFVQLKSYNTELIDPKISVDYKYHYINLNYHLHRHRCLLLDLQAKHNILQYGAISNHGVFYEGDTFNSYDWEYFTFKKMTLSDGNDPKNFSVPSQYYESFSELVSESTVDCLAMSEKTLKPLIIGKPFLVASVRLFHKKLKDMGFELYDEIFDYSFDTEYSEVKRYEMILENFKRLTQYSLTDLNNLRIKVAEKIKFNQEKVKEFIFNDEYYPETVLQAVDYFNRTGTYIDKRAVNIYKSCMGYKRNQNS